MKRTQNKIDEVFIFVKKYITENGYAPSVREICKACELKSTATAFTYLNELAERGLINKTNTKNRAVSLKQNAVTIPLIGTVAAGQPIFATENFEGYYPLPSSEFKGDDLFLLRVHGDSMIEAGILDGDKIVVKKQATAENGDIVVAMFDDGITEGATVKRFYRRDGKIILHPENKSMSDFVLDEVTLLGTVVGLLRSF